MVQELVAPPAAIAVHFENKGMTKFPISLQCLLKSSCLSPQSTILEAISALERSTVQVALVMDQHQVLLGVLGDGDIRRALLAGYRLEDQIGDIYIRDYIRVGPNAGRAEVIELMQSRQIRYVPTVDEEGRLLGIHFWSQMLSRQGRPNAACILAGGLGKRLYPLTQHLPKPMLKVAGRPILERILLHLIGHGITRFYLSINYLGDVIKQHFGDGSGLGCRITYLEEAQPLGTGGPLRLIPEALNDPLLVMNGDLITQFNVGQMLDFHAEGGWAITVASRLYQHTIPFGCLEISDSRVTVVEEKPTLVRHINAGIYVLDPTLLQRIPAGVQFPITRLLDDLIAEGGSVGSYELQDDWIDVGQKHELERARGEFQAHE